MAQSKTKYCISLTLILFLYIINTRRAFQMQSTSGSLRNNEVKPASNLLRKSFTPNAHYKSSSIEEDVNKFCKSNSTILSLWLMAPKTSNRIQYQIDNFATRGGGPDFPAHVTVVGAFPCKSDEQLEKMVTDLQKGLAGFGKVNCKFSDNPSVFKDVWNQALLFKLKVTPNFLSLCERSREILGLETKNWNFPEPVEAPHLSMFYGLDKRIPSVGEVEPIQGFDATTIELWVTDPPTLEGVKMWKKVGLIDLL